MLHKQLQLRELNVLVLEDNSDHAELIENSLRAKDECFRVDLCTQKDEFLSSLSKKNYDAFIIDYFLGDIIGLEILKELATQKNNAPVIFISGMDNDQIISEGLQAGAADFVIKSRTSLKTLPVVVKRSIIRKMVKTNSHNEITLLLKDSLTKLSEISSNLTHKLSSGDFYADEVKHLEDLLEKTAALLKKAKKKLRKSGRIKKTRDLEV